jgi:antitoxin VapB
MDNAKLFASGRSQAVRLPKQFRFQGREVAVRRFGNGVLLLPLGEPWALLHESLGEFEDGFVLERQQPAQQVRAPLGRLERRGGRGKSGSGVTPPGQRGSAPGGKVRR